MSFARQVPITYFCGVNLVRSCLGRARDRMTKAVYLVTNVAFVENGLVAKLLHSVPCSRTVFATIVLHVFLRR